MSNEADRMSPSSGKAYDSEGNIISLVSENGVLTTDCGFRSFMTGRSFVATHIFEDLASGEEGVLHFKTDGDFTCPVYSFLPTGETEYSVYINPTLTNDGTQALVANRNQANINANTANVFYNPTISDYGTLLTKRLVVGSSRVYGSIKGGDSKLLGVPDNTSVLYVFKSLDSGGDTVSAEIDWKEPDA